MSFLCFTSAHFYCFEKQWKWIVRQIFRESVVFSSLRSKEQRIEVTTLRQGETRCSCASFSQMSSAAQEYCLLLALIGRARNASGLSKFIVRVNDPFFGRSEVPPKPSALVLELISHNLATFENCQKISNTVIQCLEMSEHFRIIFGKCGDGYLTFST